MYILIGRTIQFFCSAESVAILLRKIRINFLRYSIGGPAQMGDSPGNVSHTMVESQTNCFIVLKKGSFNISREQVIILVDSGDSAATHFG